MKNKKFLGYCLMNDNLLVFFSSHKTAVISLIFSSNTYGTCNILDVVVSVGHTAGDKGNTAFAFMEQNLQFYKGTKQNFA